MCEYPLPDEREQRAAGTATYLLLLAVQLLGAMAFVWQALPEFRLVAEHPGEQLPRDAFSDLFSFSVVCVMQFAFWYRVRRVPIPFWHHTWFCSTYFCFWVAPA